MGFPRRIARATIWHPDAIPAIEAKYARPLKGFVFPVFDLLMIVAGTRGLIVGMPAIDQLFPPPGPTIIYSVWAFMAAVCFVGAVFPRLWLLEIGGKIALFTALSIYFVALRVASGGDDGAREVVSVMVAAALLIPLLRLWILGIEERARKES